MINDKKLVAIIPARGGSKRLPRKNVLDLAGKPLIAWTIEAALNSSYIDRVVVSTDNSKIASISKQYGADVPFLRPSKLATDKAPSIDVALHTIQELGKSGVTYDFVVFLQPTSPLRNTYHIDEAIELMEQKRAYNIVGVTTLNHPIEWTNTLPKDLSLKGFLGHNPILRSQDYPVRYYINGAIYIVDIKQMLTEHKLILDNNAFAYIMSRQNSIDIDTEEDWNYVEYCACKISDST